MGSSKNAREVYDYLLSIDYGVCHGPVDSINMVWVKDKPIWCGKATERIDISVDDVELFGGDEGEGGVQGVVEVYIGDEYQIASADLASRVGRTLDRMPGYRGLCHLFFRGALKDQETISYSGELEAIAHGGVEAVQEYAETVLPQTDYGFRWSSNNPYLPAAKVNATRLPSGASDSFRSIWPMGTDIDDIGVQEFRSDSGLAWFFVDNGTGTNQPEVDIATNTTDLFAGDVDTALLGDISEYIVSYEWSGSRTPYTSINPDVKLTIAFYADGPAPSEEGAIFISEFTESESGNTEFEMSGKVQVPGNTRYIVIYGEVFGENADIYAEASISIAGESNDHPGYGIILYNNSPQDDDPYAFTRLTNRDSIDLGLSTVSFSWSMSARVGGGPENYFLGIYVAFFKGIYVEVTDEFGNTYTDFVPDTENPLPVLDETGGGASITGAGTVYYNATIPVGADFIGAKGHVAFFLPLFVDVEYQTSTRASSDRNVADVHCNVDGTLGTLPDANPAHMLYELMTDNDWGMGEDPAFMGSSFGEVAETLYNESFGLSMRWTAETEIEKFAQEIIDHISAVLFPDPETGLWELKLLRDDYDVDGLDVLDPSNCTLEDRKRRLWGETINYITASYTDPQTETDAVVNADDPGSIAMQGTVVRDTRNYYGIRNDQLAQVVANRDVRASAYPLYSATAKVDRTQWKVRPGAVKKLVWPEDGIGEMIVRVMSVDYGSPTDRYIKLSVVEDVFALDATTYTSPQPGLWEPESITPENMERQMAVMAPLPFLTRNGLTVDEIDADYPLSYVGFLGYNSHPRVLNFDAYERQVVLGTPSYLELGRMPPSKSTTLPGDIIAETVSYFSASLISSIGQGQEEAGDFFLIGEGDRTSEIVQLIGLEGGTWSVLRGVYDTVPRAWPTGTVMWEFADTDTRVATIQYPPKDEGEDPYDFRLAPRMIGGRIAKEGAPAVYSMAPARPHLPFRPANCQLEETGFGPWRVPIEDDLPATVTASWATRNRTAEDSVSISWTDESVTPEVGQVVVLRIVDPYGNLEKEITDLSGETYEIPIADFGPLQHGAVEFYAENSNGDRSLMAAAIEFDIRQTGYGFNYGQDYGGPGEEVDPGDVATGFGRNYGENYGG